MGPDDDIETNLTDNVTLDEIVASRMSRRKVLQVGGAGATFAFLAGFQPAGAAAVPDDGQPGRRLEVLRYERVLAGAGCGLSGSRSVRVTVARASHPVRRVRPGR